MILNGIIEHIILFDRLKTLNQMPIPFTLKLVTKWHWIKCQQINEN